MRQDTKTDQRLLASELAQLGLNYLRRQYWREAEPPLRDALDIREKKDPNSWLTFNTQSMLGESLLGQKKYGECERLLVSGYEGIKKREQMIQKELAEVRILEALDRLISLYTVTNQPELLKKYQDLKAQQRELAPFPREAK